MFDFNGESGVLARSSRSHGSFEIQWFKQCFLSAYLLHECSPVSVVTTSPCARVLAQKHGSFAKLAFNKQYVHEVGGGGVGTHAHCLFLPLLSKAYMFSIR